MPVLRMEIETVQENGRTILRTATDLLDLTQSLNYSIKSLDSSWESDGAYDFMHEASRLVQQITQHTQELDTIAQRVMNETQQWIATDNVKSGFAEFIDNTPLSWGDVKNLAAGGYIASQLGWSSLRPNSVTLKGWMADALINNKMTHVIKPSTLLKKMAVVAYLDNVKDGVIAGSQTYYNDPEYRGTDRAWPAAILDGVVKTAILAGGTTAVIGSAAIVGGGVALLVGTTVAAPVLVGGAVLVTWVAADIVLEKAAEAPLWDQWQNSYQRDKAIEEMARLKNEVNGFVVNKVRDEVQTVNKAFRGFINNLLPLPT